jgi:hypothetical protein
MIPVNYLAIGACGVLAMIIGFLWYGPLFGKKWATLMGWGDMTPEQLAEKQKQARSSYAITFVASLVSAYVLAHALIFASAYLNASGVTAGLAAGFWNWLGFVMPVTLGSVLWDSKPWSLWFINAGYWLVQLLAMGVLLALWV